MSRLFLHCEFCGRKQADGLLSRAAWGHLELDDGRAYRVCAVCKASNADWEDQLHLLVVSPGASFNGGGLQNRATPDVA
jgi:hypothetical protein